MSTTIAHRGDVHTQAATLIAQFKRRQITGSHDVGLATARLLYRFISASRWTRIQQLIDDVRALGRRLVAAQPREFAIGNVVRRVLYVIRDVSSVPESNNGGPGNGNTGANGGSNDYMTTTSNMSADKTTKGIQELIDEIDNIDETITNMSVDMIHENEILLTPSPGSRTVLEFLLRAVKQKRHFTVLVVDSFPNESSVANEFARKLDKAGIRTVVIPDTAVFAVMSQVGKVIISTRAILANGGCISSAGVAMACECAREYRVPVLAVCSLYKVSPLYPFDIPSLIEMGDSGKVLNFTDNFHLIDTVQVMNPTYDYVAPEHIDIYITNVGGHSPSFMYRIVMDHYSPEDVQL